MCAATLYSSSKGSYKIPRLTSFCSELYASKYNNPNLRKVELKRIVRAQANVEPCLEEIWQRIPLVREEQRVVAQRAHGDADLFEVE